MVLNCERVFKHLCEKRESETVNQYCSSVCMLRRGDKDFFQRKLVLLCVRTDYIFIIEKLDCNQVRICQVNFLTCVISYWNPCLKLAQVETSYYDRGQLQGINEIQHVC